MMELEELENVLDDLESELAVSEQQNS